jgi:hypothetical protein
VRDKGGAPSAEDEGGTNELMEQLFGEEGALTQLLEQEAADSDDSETETAAAEPSDDAAPTPPPAQQAPAEPASLPPAPAREAPTLVALKRGSKTCMPVRADGQPCVPGAKLSDAPAAACKGAAPGTRVTFTNRCAHAVQIHRYVAIEGADGKARNRKSVLTLVGSGGSKFYTDCPDGGRTEKVLVAVPTGEFESARCK